MRTLVRHGIFAVAAATLAIACADQQRPASEPKPQAAFNDPQVQPVNDPIATNHNPPQKPFNDPKPQESQFSPHSAQQPISDPSPQKPFNGPGSDSDRAQAKTDRPLSDNEIIGVVMTANEGEVQMAEVAAKKATAADVKQFAGMMKSHHTSALQKDKALVKKAKISSSDSDVSSSLKSDVESTTKELRSKEGKEFDRAYIDSQVKAHKDVLTIIDNRLIPNVQNGELKSSLSEMRRTVADHLVKAENLQKKLDTGATSSVDGDKSIQGSGKASVKARTTTDSNLNERR